MICLLFSAQFALSYADFKTKQHIYKCKTVSGASTISLRSFQIWYIVRCTKLRTRGTKSLE